jgi:dihydroorotate dehydrogenase electron transfer subunit
VRQTSARVTQLEIVGSHVRVHFTSDLTLVPGQLALARLTGGYDPYLLHPLRPSAISQTGFGVDFPNSHPALRSLNPADTIEVIGPVGNGVAVSSSRPHLLLIADSDPAPLLPFAHQALARGGEATLLLARPYPLDALDPEIELRVGDLLRLAAEYASSPADHVFIHTDPALHQPLRQVLAEARAFVPPDYARVLMNRPMPCGLGACNACAVKTIHGWEWACTDGPFFRLSDIT